MFSVETPDGGSRLFLVAATQTEYGSDLGEIQIWSRTSTWQLLFGPPDAIDACGNHSECRICWETCGDGICQQPVTGCSLGCLEACWFHANRTNAIGCEMESTRFMFPSLPTVRGPRITWPRIEKPGKNAVDEQEIYAVLLLSYANSNWTLVGHTLGTEMHSEAVLDAATDRILVVAMTASEFLTAEVDAGLRNAVNRELNAVFADLLLSTSLSPSADVRMRRQVSSGLPELHDAALLHEDMPRQSKFLSCNEGTEPRGGIPKISLHRHQPFVFLSSCSSPTRSLRLRASWNKESVSVESVHEAALKPDMRRRRHKSLCDLSTLHGPLFELCSRLSTILILEQQVDDEIAAMATFTTTGPGGRRFQYVIVVSDVQPERDIVTIYRMGVQESVRQPMAMSAEKKFWFNGKIDKLDVLELSPNTFGIFPSVKQVSQLWDDPSAAYWIVKTNTQGMVSKIYVKLLPLMNDPEFTVVGYQLLAASFRGIPFLILAEICDRGLYIYTYVLSAKVFKTVQRMNVRGSHVFGLHLNAGIDGAALMIRATPEKPFPVLLIYDSETASFQELDDFKCSTDLVVGSKTTSGFGIIGPGDRVEMEPTPIRPIKFRMKTDGLVQISPGAIFLETRCVAIAILLRKTSAVTEYRSTWTLCQSEWIEEYFILVSGFSCLLDSGMYIEDTMLVDGISYLIGVQPDSLATLVAVRVSPKIFDITSPILTRTSAHQERLAQLQTLITNTMNGIKSEENRYGFDRDGDALTPCEVLEAVSDSIPNLTVDGEVRSAEIRLEAPIPKFPTLSLSALTAVVVEVDLAGIKKSFDFLEERLQAIEAGIAEGKVTLVRLEADFFANISRLYVNDMKLYTKSSSGELDAFKVSDYVLASDAMLEFAANKSFSSPLKVDQLTLSMLNGKTMNSFSFASEKNLVFSKPVTFSGSLHMGGHAVFRDGVTTAGIDISSEAFPLYRSKLLSNVIPVYWTFEDVHIARIEGPAVVNEVDLSHLLTRIVLKNQSDPIIINGSLIFREGTDLRIRDDSGLQCSRNILVNNLLLSDVISKAVPKSSSLKLRRLDLRVISANVSYMNFWTDDLNGQQRGSPLQALARAGHSVTVGGRLIVEEAKIVTMPKCISNFSNVIPLNGAPVFAEGMYTFKKGLRVKDHLNMLGNQREKISKLQEFIRSEMNAVVKNLEISDSASLTVMKGFKGEAVNDEKVSTLLKSIIRKDQKKLVIDAPVSLRQLIAREAIILYGTFPHNLARLSSNQIFTSPVAFSKPVLIRNVSTYFLGKHRMDDDRRVDLGRDYVFNHFVNLSNMEFSVRKLILRVPDLLKSLASGVMKTSDGTTIFQRHVIANELEIRGNIHSDFPRTSPEWQNFITNRVKLESKDIQEIRANISIRHLGMNSGNIKMLNGMSEAALDEMLQKCSRRHSFLETLKVRNLINLEGINGLNFSELIANAVKIDGNVILKSDVTFHHPVKAESFSVKHIDGILFPSSLKNLVFTNSSTEHQTISGKKTFSSFMKVGHLEISNSFNGHHPSHLLTTKTRQLTGDVKFNDGSIVGDLDFSSLSLDSSARNFSNRVIFVESATLRSMQCGTLNGARLEHFLEHAVRLDAPSKIEADIRIQLPGIMRLSSGARGYADFLNGVSSDKLRAYSAFYSEIDGLCSGGNLTLPFDFSIPWKSCNIVDLELTDDPVFASSRDSSCHAWASANVSFVETVRVDSLHVGDLIDIRGNSVDYVDLCRDKINLSSVGPVAVHGQLDADMINEFRNFSQSFAQLLRPTSDQGTCQSRFLCGAGPTLISEKKIAFPEEILASTFLQWKSFVAYAACSGHGRLESVCKVSRFPAEKQKDHVLFLSGVVRDVKMFSVETPDGGSRLFLVAATQTEYGSDLGEIQIWSRTSTWQMEVVVPGAAEKLRIINRKLVPILLAASMRNSSLVFYELKFHSSGFLASFVDAFPVNGNFDLMESSEPLVAFRDTQGGLTLRSLASRLDGPQVVTSCSRTTVIKFLKASSRNFLAVADQEDSFIPGGSTIKIMEIDALTKTSTYQTIRTSRVVDVDTMPTSECGDICFVALEEQPKGQVFCRKGDSGFQEEINFYGYSGNSVECQDGNPLFLCSVDGWMLIRGKKTMEFYRIMYKKF
ncbi:unnamed protein product [Notodromas monacha]|uniref:Uncharacterized protein n=1 Tax=Notodromas monacha TaxID=399045 RepID=A0A7R9BJF0_9CRUS|nr:unnamed protein product [Notodromas monacha]CAG0915074.1 unnamed protein product [Notodromas monacha]